MSHQHHLLLRFLVLEAIQNMLFETHYLEEADYPPGFDVQHFKSLRSFNQRVQYARQHLARLGSGSSRLALLVDPTTVIKIAKNNKGMAQNKAEIDASNVGYEYIAEIKDYDQEGLWIEMERATKFSVVKFKQITGYSFQDFSVALRYWNDVHQPRGNSRLAERPANYDVISDSDLFNDVIGMMHNHEMPVGDLIRPSSWGFVQRNGREVPVLIDYGLTNDVWDTYYARKRQMYEQQSSGALAMTPQVARKKTETTPQQRQPFNMEQFKSVQGGLEQKMRYLYKTLPQVGEGSSRNVFKLSDKVAIKMAKNDAGIAQNKAEATVCTVDPGLALFAKVSEVGQGYEWLASELAVPMTEDKFKELVGIDWQTFGHALMGASNPNPSTNSEERRQAVAALVNNSWFKRVLNVIRACKYKPGDLTKLDSWGIVNGRPVIIDSGFTEAVYAAHYVNQQSQNNN